MNKKMKKYRQKNESHQELIHQGFSLKPQQKKRQCKDCIMESRRGNNGRTYYKTTKMSKFEKSIFDKADRLRKAGKEVYSSYEPMMLFFDLIKKGIDISAKKDKYGNIHITVKKEKKSKHQRTKGVNSIV